MNDDSKRRLWVILCGVALVVAARLLIAVSRIDDGSFQYYSGNIAWAVIQGLPLEWRELPLIAHNRGSMLVGFLAVPFMALLGPTHFAVKLVAIAFSAGTAGIFVSLLARHCGILAAVVGGVVYTLLPPSFQMLDVMTQGSHVDTLLFDFAALAVLLGAAGRPPSTARTLAFGLTCGAGLFFSFHFLVVLPALLVCWWRIQPRFVLRPAQLLTFAAGFAVTFLPFVFFLPETAGATEVVGRPLEERVIPLGAALYKLWNQTILTWPSFWMFRSSGCGWAIWPYGLALVAGFVALLPRLRRGHPLTLFLVLYPALLLVAFSFSNFVAYPEKLPSGMNTRYVAPAMPCMAAWVAIGAQALVERGRKLVAILVVSAAVVAGAAGTASLVNVANATEHATVKGTKFPLFKRQIPRAARRDRERILGWIDVLDPDWEAFRPLHYRNVRTKIRNPETWEEFRDALDECTAAGDRLAPFLLVTLGTEIRSQAEAVLWIERSAVRADREARDWLLRGLGSGTYFRDLFVRQKDRGSLVIGMPALRRLIANLKDEEAALALQGAGFSWGQMAEPYRRNVGDIVLLDLPLAGAQLEAFYVGVGWGYRMRYFEEDYEPPKRVRFETQIPAEGRAAFRRGLAWSGPP